MQSWQRFTALTMGVLALHGAALWVVYGFLTRVDFVDRSPALLTRMVELPKVQEVTLPTPPPAIQPIAKPVATKAAPQAAPTPSSVPQPSTAPVAAPTAPAPLPLATNNPTPAPNAPTGSAAPTPAAPPAATVASTVQAAKAPAVAAAVQLPLADVEHADNQYRAPYPKLSQRLGEEGRVQLLVRVGADGKPTSATVVKSSGFDSLDRAGIDTVMRWRYKPGTRGGVPEPMHVLQAVDFKLPN
jgi:periplasmic protein TonB